MRRFAGHQPDAVFPGELIAFNLFWQAGMKGKQNAPGGLKNKKGPRPSACRGTGVSFFLLFLLLEVIEQAHHGEDALLTAVGALGVKLICADAVHEICGLDLARGGGGPTGNAGIVGKGGRGLGQRLAQSGGQVAQESGSLLTVQITGGVERPVAGAGNDVRAGPGSVFPL